MRFSTVSYMVKTLAFYIIMVRIFTMSEKGLLTSVLKCTISFESHKILMRFGNQKATNNVRVVEHLCVLDPVK